MTEADARHLRRAIEPATAARAAGDLLFGSLLVAPIALGRVVAALSCEQLRELQPAGVVSPDAAEVAYTGDV
jgi:hypothetical protein